MIKTYSLYDRVTGLFTGKQMRCDDSAMRATQLPEGILAFEGAFDHLSQRVDVATGQVVLYQPPAPSEQHEWNAHTHRWQLGHASGDVQQRQSQVMARIHSLEINQGRALREATLGDAAAFKRLKEIDDAIQVLRRELV